MESCGHALRLNARLGARSENNPLVNFDPIPFSTTSQGWVDDVARLVVTKSEIRI